MSYLSVVLADSPSLLWPLNETSGTTAADASGNSQAGAYNGGYTLASAAAPGTIGGNAVLLNGSTGTVVSTYGPSLTSVSLECWFNLNSLTQNSNFTLIGNDHPDSSNKGIYLYSQGVGNVLLIVVGNGTTFDYSYGGATPATGWHHLVGTYNGSNFYLYLDTVQIAAGSIAGPLATGGYAFNAGNNPGYAGENVHGLMSWTAIYPVALTSAQVLNHYNAAFVVQPPAALPVPPGLASPMAWQRRAVPARAPLLAPGGDTGAGAESGTISTSGTDTGAGAETGTIQVSDTDAGTGADTATISVSSADTGSGAETSLEGPAVASLTLTPPGRLSPAAWQAHAWPAPAPLLVPSGDSGTGADTATVAVSDTDAGSGAETASVTVSSQDTGTGAETSAVSVLGADAATGADTATIGVAGPDTGAGADTAAITVSGAEAAAGADTAAIGITAPDTAAGADTAAVGVQAADAGTGADTGSATTTVPGGDAGSGADSGTVPQAPPPHPGGTAASANAYGGSTTGNTYGGSAE